MFYLYTLIYSKVILNLSFRLLLNINAILKKVENQTVAGPQCGHNVDSNCLVFHLLQNIFLLMSMSVVLYSILIRRYNDISSKADRGDIFIRAAAGQMGA